MIGIYKITSPSGKIYIGQSIDIKKRFKQYKNKKCKSQNKLYNSFVKYEVENHIFEIIEECIIENLNERERYWQEFYNVIGKNGLNCQLTNTLIKKKVVSFETKKILREKRLNFKCSYETIEKIKIARAKQIITEAHKNKISNSMKGSKNHFYGKKHSKESIDLIKFKNSQKAGELNNFYGKKHSDKTKKILSEKRKNLINSGFLAYSKNVVNTNNGIKYKSLAELCRSENLNYANARSGIYYKLKKYSHIKYVN